MPEDHTNPSSDPSQPVSPPINTSTDTVSATPLNETQETEQQRPEFAEAMPDHEPRPWLQVEQPRRKRGPIIGAVIAATILVLGIGGWSAYALWYQSPEKVVMDAIVNAITAKTVSVTGTLSGKMDNTSINATVDGQFGYKEGASASVKVSTKENGSDEMKFDAQVVHSPKGSDYVKVTNLKTIYQQLLNGIVTADVTNSAVSAQTRQKIEQLYGSLFGPIVEKIDGKWVGFSSTDIRKLGGGTTNGYDCVSKTLMKIGDDLGSMIEIGAGFQNNKFIIVKEHLGSIDGSQGYKIEVDQSKQKQFYESLKSTKLYKEIQDCSEGSGNPLDILKQGNENTGSAMQFEVWVSQWGHQLTKVRVVQPSTGGEKKENYIVDVIPKFNSPIQVHVPTDSIAFQDVVSPIFAQILGFGSSVGAGSLKL